MRFLLVVLLVLCVGGAAVFAGLFLNEYRQDKEEAAFYGNITSKVVSDKRPAALNGYDEPDFSEQVAIPTDFDISYSESEPEIAETSQQTATDVNESETAENQAENDGVADDDGQEPTVEEENNGTISGENFMEYPPVQEEIQVNSACDFKELWKTCPDVVGWIRIEGTKIDYPVVKGEDNVFYLKHLPDRTPNKAASIMMDVANTGDFMDMVNILHGHHMRSGSMFGHLELYDHESYYKKHPVIQLFTPEGDYEVPIFAAYSVNGLTYGYPTYFATEAEFNGFVQRAISGTQYDTGIRPVYGDRILMLSTCSYSYKGERYIVLGVY